jgi:glycosyltransferase involved in cell wall biosynthesis
MHCRHLQEESVRVVHISTCHQPLDVRIYHKECRSLAKAGHEVRFLVADAPPGNESDVRFENLTFPPGSRRFSRIFKRLREAYKCARDLRADVYHFHDPELIPVGIMLKWVGARVIYDVHEDSPREAIAVNRDRPLEGRIKSMAWSLFEMGARRVLDGFVCATPTIARKFPPARTAVVRNYPQLEEFSTVFDSATPPDGITRIIYVGGLSAIRGVREMVRSMTCLPPELGTRLTLLGNFFPASLQTEMERQPGWQHVDYLGWQERDRVIQELSRARLGLLVLHPEQIHLDSLPIKLFEYMGAGLPVIASDFPLWREIIEESGCGLLVDPLNPAAIAGAIRELLENPGKARDMGNRGRRAVLTKFNWSFEAQKLVGLYNQISSSDRRASA